MQLFVNIYIKIVNLVFNLLRPLFYLLIPLSLYLLYYLSLNIIILQHYRNPIYTEVSHLLPFFVYLFDYNNIIKFLVLFL